MGSTLYVTDLDGTLLTTDGYISEKSLNIINGLINEGMHFTYATARSLISARKVTKGLRTDIPVIVYNGAFIMQADTGKVLYSSPFTDKERDDLNQLLRRTQAHPLIYSFIDESEKLSWDERYVNEGTAFYLSQRPNDPRLRPVQGDDALYQGDIFYYTCIGTESELNGIYEALKDDKRFHVTFQRELYRFEFWLEIMPIHATKAQAMEHLKQLWGCERTVAFGDAVNDIPMFQAADEAYAVDNAVPELKQYADKIIDDHDQDGVANWVLSHYKK